MKSIGVRELRQRASEFLKQVEGGRTFEVTAHGRPVALLVPVGRADRRSELVTRGRIVAGTGDVLDLGAPLRPARGVARPGVLLGRLRDGER